MAAATTAAATTAAAVTTGAATTATTAGDGAAAGVGARLGLGLSRLGLRLRGLGLSRLRRYGGYGYGVPGGTVTVLTGEWAIVDDGRFAGNDARLSRRPLHRHGRRLRRSRLPLPEEGRLPARVPARRVRDQAIDVSARAGAQMKISEKLKKIPGAKQYGSYDNPEPEGGVQRFWSKESNAPASIPSTRSPGVRPSAGAALARRWHGQRWRVRRRSTSARPLPAARPRSDSRAAGADSARRRRARIIFRVTPGDAAVYMNDHFIGTGEELSTLTRGFQVAARPAHADGVPAGHGDPRARPWWWAPERAKTVEISLRIRTEGLAGRISARDSVA